MKYYLAYGSNLNKEQMAHRCPDAKPICKWTVSNYQLVFRCGFLTIEPKEGAEVPCGVWEISEQDERNLDRYEGHPYFYRKEYFPAMVPDPEELTGKLVTALVYVMNEGRRIQAPSDFYFYSVYGGYLDFGLDTARLVEAYERAKWPEDSTTVSTTNSGHE